MNRYFSVAAMWLGLLVTAVSAQDFSTRGERVSAISTLPAKTSMQREFRLRGDVVRVTTNSESQGNASIHGRYAAWTQWSFDPSPETDIYLYDLLTGAERKITGAGVQYQCTLSNRKLAYTDASKGERDDDIMVYDLGTRETVRLDRPGSQWGPEISGHWMVYNDLRHTNNEVYLCDLRTMTETRLTDSLAIQGGPHVSGHQVVWTDFETGNGEVSLLDLFTGTITNLTQNSAYDGQSAIDGDIVVFVSARDGGIPNLFYHRVRSGQTIQVTHASGLGVTDPHVSGDYISYFEHDPGSNRYNVRIHSISRGVNAPLPDVPTCLDCFRAWNAISGNRVIFSDVVDGNQDVYLFTFRFEKL